MSGEAIWSFASRGGVRAMLMRGRSGGRLAERGTETFMILNVCISYQGMDMVYTANVMSKREKSGYTLTFYISIEFTEVSSWLCSATMNTRKRPNPLYAKHRTPEKST